MLKACKGLVILLLLTKPMSPCMMHMEIGLGQELDIEPLQTKVVDIVIEGGGERGGIVKIVEASTASRHDHGEVIY